MTTLETYLLYLGLAGYALGLLFAIFYLRDRQAHHMRISRILSLSAVFCHAALLVAGGARHHTFPIETLFDAVVFLGVLLILTGLAIDLMWSVPLVTVAALPMILSCFVTALAFLRPQEGPRSLNLVVSIHTIVTLLAYAAFGLAFILGLLYMFEHRQLKVRAQSSLFELLPSLEWVYRMNVRSMGFGFIMLTSGILTGYLYARSAHPGSAWRMDPKVLLSTFTWVAYLTVLIMALIPSCRGKKIVMASVVSFCLVMVTFWASLFWKDFFHS